MSKDMTRGNPLGLILKFFIPVLLGSVFQQFYSMVDTIVVGKFVGVNALAGVGATGSINFLILGFAMGITIGFGVKVGQRFGAKDYEGMRNYMANGFYLIVIISAIMTPLTMYFCKDILELTGTPEEIFSDSYNYLIWILAGTFFSMLYNAASAILRAIGDSRTPLFALIFFFRPEYHSGPSLCHRLPYGNHGRGCGDGDFPGNFRRPLSFLHVPSL